MEYFIVLILMPIAQSSRMPLLNNLRAPLVADLDITSLNKELKEYIDGNVKDEVSQKCHAKIQTAVNDSLIDLKSDIFENFEGDFNDLEQKTTAQFKSLENNLRKENKELIHNFTTETNKLHLELRKENEQLKSLENSLRKENKELIHNFTTETDKWNLELRKENEKLKSDLEELKNRISVMLQLTDCFELIGITNKSGVYLIHPGVSVEFKTYCDMETDGGGWTVFQRRFNGQTDFYRGCNDYKEGFGDLQAEFWMGNFKLALMTSQRQYELRINLEDFNGSTAFAKYSTFAIGDESTKYKLTVGGYSGTAGDSLNVHNNQAFSTKDSDNDQYSGNCATERKGAWWYQACATSNLNGLYGNPGSNTGMYWYHWKNNWQSMKTTSMMIRRKRT